MGSCARRVIAARGPLSAWRRLSKAAYADLSSLPPVTIHASSDELLLPDAELMAKRLNARGIRCDLHLWDGQIHDFPLAADILPEGRRAIRYIGDFVKEVTAEHVKLRGAREYRAMGAVRSTATAG